MLAVSLVDDDEIRAALARSAQTMRTGMVTRLAASRAHGRVRDDIDLETAAWLWLGMTLAGGFAYALDPEEARNWCRGWRMCLSPCFARLKNQQEI